jgi:hypothetical protein
MIRIRSDRDEQTKERHTEAIASALFAAELRFQALNLILNLREPPRDGDLIAEKDGPDNHPGYEQALKILHRINS